MRALEALRAATREQHERIDHGEFAHAVLDGSLSMARYGSFLRAVRVVWEALGQVSASSRAGERVERLTRDLAYLQLDPQAVDEAASHARALGERIRVSAGGVLHGVSYVMEGSQLGGLFQKKALESRPELAGGGLAYLTGAGRDTQAQFREFLATLEDAVADEATLQAAIAGATHTFGIFEEIVKAVMAPTTER